MDNKRFCTSCGGPTQEEDTPATEESQTHTHKNPHAGQAQLGLLRTQSVPSARNSQPAGPGTRDRSTLDLTCPQCSIACGSSFFCTKCGGNTAPTLLVRELHELRSKVKELGMAISRKESEIAEMRRFEQDSKHKGEELKSLQNRFDSLTINFRNKKDELEKVKEQLRNSSKTEGELTSPSSSARTLPPRSTTTPATNTSPASTTSTSASAPTPTPIPEAVAVEKEQQTSGGSVFGTLAVGMSMLAVGVAGGAYFGLKMKHQ